MRFMQNAVTMFNQQAAWREDLLLAVSALTDPIYRSSASDLRL
jgi:hypothetical protein